MSKAKIIVGSVASLVIVTGCIVGGYFLYMHFNNQTMANSTSQSAAKAPIVSAPVTAAAVTAAPVVHTETTTVLPPWVQAEIAALKLSVSSLQAMQGTSNYLCPLNSTSSSGQCLQIGANGQMQSALTPYAKMQGGGSAIGFTSGMTLILPKSFVEGGMTYSSVTGQATVPWAGRYEVSCLITTDINKAGFVSIARNGVVNETYGRIYQNNATDSSNGYIGSNTFALPANEKISLVITKQGTNNGSIQGNYQDTWWTIRYIGPINVGTSV